MLLWLGSTVFARTERRYSKRNISKQELCCISRNNFRRCEACL